MSPAIPETLSALRVSVASLVPYGANPRHGDVDGIATSLEVNGQYRPIVVRSGTNEVLAGNHTLLAARQLGWTDIAATFVECDEEQAKRIVLVDNRSNDVADYDDSALVDLLQSLEDGLLGTGYDQDALDALIAGTVELPPVLDDPDAVPDVPAEPRSVLGDVWLLGPHRLMCGDALSVDDVDQLLDGVTPGIVYTDPPYGISIVKGNGKIGSGGKFRGKIGSGKIVPTTEYLPVAGDDTTDVARDAFTLLFTAYPEAAHVWWGGNHYASSASLPDSSCWLIWDKDNGGNDFADAEIAWTNHKGAVRLLRHMWNGMLRASERGKRVHPTQKPVALAEWAFTVVDLDHQRDTVLDVFGGSGSTLMAAHTTGRRACLIEMEPSYVDVICRRYQEATSTVPILESTGEPHDFTGG